jgi:prolyl 4-hydroxylase
MHHDHVSTNYPWLPHNVDPSIPTPDEYKDMPIQPLGEGAQQRYEEFMQGCVDFYNAQDKPKGDRCIQNERERIAMTLRQPQSVYNYTEMGFTKIRAPDHVFSLLKEFWDKNHGKEKPEQWIPGNIYTNHWKSPTDMLSVEDAELEGGGFVLKQHIWNAARDTIEEWTGHKQAECSLYGIRIYRDGAQLAPHVDRLPLVSSAIINVAQDVDEPWPLEVIGHDGKAYNVTMEPGDLVLYESHSIIHGTNE